MIMNFRLHPLFAGNGSQDIFAAIMFAYNLISRPEATKSFILIPCSDCNIYNMEVG